MIFLGLDTIISMLSNWHHLVLAIYFCYVFCQLSLQVCVGLQSFDYYPGRGIEVNINSDLFGGRN